MITYPNSKIITVQSKEPCDSKHIYACINKEALQAAFSNLSYSGRALWIMLASNQEGYTFAISRKDCIDNWNIKSSTYDRAIKELIDCGYLYQEDENTNQWYFQEII